MFLNFLTSFSNAFLPYHTKSLRAISPSEFYQAFILPAHSNSLSSLLLFLGDPSFSQMLFLLHLSHCFQFQGPFHYEALTFDHLTEGIYSLIVQSYHFLHIEYKNIFLGKMGRDHFYQGHLNNFVLCNIYKIFCYKHIIHHSLYNFDNNFFSESYIVLKEKFRLKLKIKYFWKFE